MAAAKSSEATKWRSLSAPCILSYAIMENYLIGFPRNREKPLYVWQIPSKLVPRKPLAVSAGDGK